MTNYTKHAIKGTIIVLVVSVLAAFLGYIARLVMARGLSVEDFGLFYAVFAFLALLGVFKSLGFEKSLIKFIPEFVHKKRDDYIKSSIIYVLITQVIINMIIIIAIYFLSDYLSVHFFHTAKAGIVLRLMAIAFFADSFVNVLKFSFQGFQRMVLFSGIDAVRMLLILMFIIIGLKMGYGLFSPIAAYIIVPVILLAAFGWILVNNVFPNFFHSKFVIDKFLMKKISKYSIFVLVSGSAAIILGYTDVMVLTYFKGVNDVALYNVALPTAKILIYLPTAIGSILLPLTSELWTKRKETLLKAGMESLYKYSMIITLPMVFVIISFSDLITGTLFGKSYILAGAPMQILSIGMIFMTMHLINVNFFLGIGQPQIQSKILYIAAIFNLITGLLLIPKLGTIGAALATSASFLIMMVMGLINIRRFITIKFPIRLWSKILSAGIVFVLAIYFLKNLIKLNVWIEAGIVLTISGVIYGILLFLLKVIDFNELNGLYNRIFR